MNVKLVISYFGKPFVGWQKTPMGPSIEGSLEAALEKVLQHPVQLQAASRTDAGVHAEGQVVNFKTEKSLCLQTLKRSLNQMLPREISVVSMEECAKDFHPTLNCLKKEYWYHLCKGSLQLPFHRHTSWHFPYALDLAKMKQGAKLLLGRHDFSSFCNERNLWDRSPICRVETIELVSLENNRLKISIVGDHFLYRMARNLVGTLAYVGCGKISFDQLPNILAKKDRTTAGMTAPAHGLLLKRVFY